MRRRRMRRRRRRRRRKRLRKRLRRRLRRRRRKRFNVGQMLVLIYPLASSLRALTT